MLLLVLACRMPGMALPPPLASVEPWPVDARGAGFAFGPWEVVDVRVGLPVHEPPLFSEAGPHPSWHRFTFTLRGGGVERPVECLAWIRAEALTHGVVDLEERGVRCAGLLEAKLRGREGEGTAGAWALAPVFELGNGWTGDLAGWVVGDAGAVELLNAGRVLPAPGREADADLAAAVAALRLAEDEHRRMVRAIVR